MLSLYHLKNIWFDNIGPYTLNFGNLKNNYIWMKSEVINFALKLVWATCFYYFCIGNNDAYFVVDCLFIELMIYYSFCV